MEAEIIWPKKDLKAMQTAIKRAIRDLGKTPEQAVEWAARLVARAAVPRTKSAPKKRRAYVNREKSGRFNKRRFPYFRKIWVKGPKQIRKWYIKEKTDPKYSEIKRAGLAKNSWKWMIPKIKKGGGNFASEIRRRKHLVNFELEMINKLPYILEALKQQEGNRLLDQALGVAAAKMEKQIDYKLQKMAK